MTIIFSTISSGPDTGKRLLPHLHKGGYYVASTSRFEKDYVRVKSLEELEVLIRAGYGARLKSPESKNAPSIITSANIHFESEDNSRPTPKNLLPDVVNEADLDPESVSTRRKEQAFLRAFLLGGKLVGSCKVCERELPQELLIAAHLKARAKCTDAEKLDFDNIAALMCRLGCDSLYEEHYIYVEGGIVRQNPNKSASATDHLKVAIESVLENSVKNWSGSKIYYAWHRVQCLRP